MTTPPNLPQLPQKSCALRVVPQPSDANVHGDVFGGWIMAQVDIAGSIPASRRANGRVATIAVNSFIFKQPVFVGDLLSFYADIVKTGKTSITISYYHAVGADIAATSNYELFETVVLAKARRG